MSSPIFGPEVEDATLGLPPNTKILKADFYNSLLLGLVETKGTRLAWSRAAVCPCQSIDGQTQAPDPNCPLCKLTPGFIYFRPEEYAVDAVTEIGKIDDVQKFLIERPLSPGVVIRGLITSVARSETAYDRLGDWVFGAFNITVRPTNKIGYFDRITCLDSEMIYSQIVHITEKTGPIELRFPATKVSFCRTTDQLFLQDADFTLDEQGRLVFEKGRRPPFKARLSVHYHHHPQFIVQEHVNAFRESIQRSKVSDADRQTPIGNIQHLPIRAMAKLEFLLGQGATP
jgi:hypothetical protein